MSKPVIIDCDPGTDDAIALWLALAAPEIDLRLVTVAGGNTGLDRTTANARAVLGLAGSAAPIVVAGSATCGPAPSGPTSRRASAWGGRVRLAGSDA